MSRYEWERGTIKLPSAEFARIRQAVQDADTRQRQKVFDLTQDFWKGLSRKQQTDPAAYRKAADDFIVERHRDNERVHSGYGYNYTSVADEAVEKAIDDADDAIRLRHGQDKPARVLKADMNFPTNRTTVFRAGEASISFDRDAGTVEWEVPENNYAIEHARAHVCARNLFQALDTVKWTRNTGGSMTSSDEYAADAGRGPSASVAYGPIGAIEHPNACRPYTDSQGRRITDQVLSKMWADKMTAEMNLARKLQAGARSTLSGVQPRGHNGHAGQFTYKTHAEPTVRLY